MSLLWQTVTSAVKISVCTSSLSPSMVFHLLMLYFSHKLHIYHNPRTYKHSTSMRSSGAAIDSVHRGLLVLEYFISLYWIYLRPDPADGHGRLTFLWEIQQFYFDSPSAYLFRERGDFLGIFFFPCSCVSDHIFPLGMPVMIKIHIRGPSSCSGWQETAFFSCDSDLMVKNRRKKNTLLFYFTASVASGRLDEESDAREYKLHVILYSCWQLVDHGVGGV